MKNSYKNRKFGLSVFFALTSTVALFTNFIGGGEYITIIGLMFSLYRGVKINEESK